MLRKLSRSSKNWSNFVIICRRKDLILNLDKMKLAFLNNNVNVNVANNINHRIPKGYVLPAAQPPTITNRNPLLHMILEMFYLFILNHFQNGYVSLKIHRGKHLNVHIFNLFKTDVNVVTDFGL